MRNIGFLYHHHPHQNAPCQGSAMQPQNKNRITLYLVYATALNDGSVIEDTVAASNEDEAYQKARALYPRHQFDVTVYLQSADDD